MLLSDYDECFLHRHAYQIDIELVSSFKDKTSLPDVRIVAPVPSASYVRCQIKNVSVGKAEYHPSPINAVIWTYVRSFHQRNTHTRARAHTS